jgi:hypothetical protein
MFQVQIERITNINYYVIDACKEAILKELPTRSDLLLAIREIEAPVSRMEDKDCIETFTYFFKMCPVKPNYMHIAFLYELYIAYESTRSIVLSELIGLKDTIAYFKQILRGKNLYELSHSSQCVVSVMFRSRHLLKEFPELVFFEEDFLDDFIHDFDDDIWHIKLY